MFVARRLDMNVFDLDQALVNDYERFARSFTLIRAPDIRQQVEKLYASDRFWPEPLVSINPRFESGDSVDRLVTNETLRSATGSIFSIEGKPLSLYRHQAQAVAKAATRQSFVVTTGTGSGKCVTTIGLAALCGPIRRPLPASLAGGAGARPDHPLSRHWPN